MQQKEDPRSRQFMMLFLKSQRRLYNYVMSVIPSPSEADDIVQETASVMWTKFDEYTPGTDFSAWGISIARFKILRYLRDRKTYLKKFSSKAFSRIEELEAESVCDEDFRAEALRQCLQDLNENERRVIALRYEGDRTLKSLAGRLGMNINTIYSRLSKIHHALLSCIKRKTAGL